MTENEAIRRCDLLINGYSVSCSTNDAFKDENKGHMTFETMREFAETCKQALEEIQQCRAIGTVEDVAFYKKCYDEESYEYCGEYGTDNCGCKDRMEYLEKKVAELEAIGTIEEFKALKEKSVEKKPLLRLCGDCQRGCTDCDRYEDRCPTCNGGLYVESEKPHEHCSHCGQKLDWSE